MANRLKQARVAAGFTRASDFARRVGVSTSYVYMIEQGRRVPSIEIAARMAEVLLCTVDDLFVSSDRTDCVTHAV